jgi:hypothetical protein
MKKIFNLNAVAIVIGSLLVIGCAASKTSVDPYIGEWHYTFPSMDGGEMKATMTINAAEKGHAGFLTSEMGSVDLQDLVIEDGNLTAKFDIQGMTINLKGKFEGDTYNGTTIVDGNEFPMIATRKPVEK